MNIPNKGSSLKLLCLASLPVILIGCGGGSSSSGPEFVAKKDAFDVLEARQVTLKGLSVGGDLYTEIDWGDGTVEEIRYSYDHYSHDYDGSYTGEILLTSHCYEPCKTTIDISGNVKIDTSGLTNASPTRLKVEQVTEFTGSLSNLPNSVKELDIDAELLEGDLADLPSSLTSLSLRNRNNQGTISGNIASLPSSITYLSLDSTEDFVGSLADLPSSIKSVYIDKNTLSGSLSELSRSIEWLRIGNASLTYQGDELGDLPPNLISLDLYNWTVTGDISALPRTLTHLNIRDGNAVYGTISELPTSLTSLTLGNGFTLTGMYSELPRKLTSLSFGEDVTISGSMGDLPSTLTSFSWDDATPPDQWVTKLPNGLGRILLDSKTETFASDYVDSILSVLDANGLSSSNSHSSLNVHLTGNMMEPATDTGAIDSLTSKGWTVNVKS
ncbi:hypothetical protein GTG28_06565 [Vibrio sp. OCN044]|uniref:Leucine-rich repeat domain-containing protein n=1 Tax=Vibrio tetraodonis subsp. pristinus TaxID=2695891 RepID=A0A6L8LS23_9VIBR|nr:FNIP repeat-containing protein [Vibrio tetraodonis]MYM58881.1 hypothetical protein [Vibrio tetraodonis subsp. pristinus]